MESRRKKTSGWRQDDRNNAISFDIFYRHRPQIEAGGGPFDGYHKRPGVAWVSEDTDGTGTNVRATYSRFGFTC